MNDSDAPAPPGDWQLHDAAGLEFPDWSGMVSHEVQMTFEQAVRWNEEMLAMFPLKADRAARDANAKCQVEFKLS